ncbi:unnamed protein product [Acanthoscelides obtectus]|uniref:Uncharacterized protein n=1 Tax=Acanthoscelides obtectus TaxID=200917 RepID=A0A9P0QGG8_ACAOB|nr:unnamed protein product [Acanthoscelides obtectus]CAH2020116.1 unnamed protein product [Acanthoscelides obtectus]CAH2020120.1 unnamed protein product [Acanthoscelides obtectus]CAK1682821.1 Putative apoptosis inhibitor ORF99 [Acanthoscelides obtectus]CAK1682945.1 Putative apoptosis inhibitor ORF99 [Acanthoscelides obtectus]
MCAEEYSIDFSEYNSYDKRISTFEKGWTGVINPAVLAAAGFFYVGSEDICQAFCCGIIIYKWKDDDCPIKDHLKFSKNCD